jgi:hypothetical protein
MANQIEGRRLARKSLPSGSSLVGWLVAGTALTAVKSGSTRSIIVFVVNTRFLLIKFKEGAEKF